MMVITWASERAKVAGKLQSCRAAANKADALIEREREIKVIIIFFFINVGACVRAVATLNRHPPSFS